VARIGEHVPVDHWERFAERAPRINWIEATWPYAD
jgi:hypothetical protein